MSLAALRARLTGIRHPYYGWYITGLAFLCFFVTSSTNSFTFGIFLPAMHEDLGWDRSTIVLALSIASGMASLTGPVLGRIVDQRGPKGVLVASILFFCGSLMATAMVDAPWQYFLTFGVVGGTARSALGSVLPGSMIANWFRRKRATAYTITAMGPPVANLIMTPFTSWLVAGQGWRNGWAAHGLLGLAMGLAPALIITRRRPEDYGLLPDGDTQPSADEQGRTERASTQTEDSWTASEALHSRAFWMVAAGMALILTAPSISVVFLYSYLTSMGTPTADAALAVSAVSLIQVISRLAFWTPVIQRFGVRWAVLVWGGCLFSSSMLLALVDGQAWAYVATVVLGLAMGGNLVLQLGIWPDYFGREAVGSIIGISQLLQGIASAVVPFVLAAQLDRTGNYGALYLSVASLVFSGMVLHAIVGKPRRPERMGVTAHP